VTGKVAVNNNKFGKVRRRRTPLMKLSGEVAITSATNDCLKPQNTERLKY